MFVFHFYIAQKTSEGADEFISDIFSVLKQKARENSHLFTKRTVK